MVSSDGSAAMSKDGEVAERAPRRERRPKPAPKPMRALSIFHEPWWLDIATDGQWEEAKIERGGQIVGRLPYFVRRRPWLTSTMPPLTRTLGPSIETRNSNSSVEFRNRLSIADELIGQLPDFVHFSHVLDPRTEEALAFVQRGFRVSTGYTFWIERERSKENAWAGLRDKTRNLIRRAGEQLTVRRIDDASVFCRFYNENLEARDLNNVYDPNLMKRLVDGAMARDSGCVLGAFDQAGTLCAIIVLVWDQHSAYYLLSTRSRQAHNGAVSLLLWNAIQMAIDRELVFDFDGFANDTGLSFLTGFGGIVKPKLIVERTRPWYAALRSAKSRASSLRLAQKLRPALKLPTRGNPAQAR